jgi:hypothetical protein
MDPSRGKQKEARRAEKLCSSGFQKLEKSFQDSTMAVLSQFAYEVS